VEWHAIEPGEWDCHGRDDVIRTLRERYAQGFASGELECRDGGEQAVIVVSHPSQIGGPDWPSETATVMQFRNERVVSMQDYRTEAGCRAEVARTRRAADAVACAIACARFFASSAWRQFLEPAAGLGRSRAASAAAQRSHLGHCFRAAAGFALEP